jgi:hypothetical protein
MMTGCGAVPSRSSPSSRGSLPSSPATLLSGLCHRYLPSSSLCWSSMGFSFIICPPTLSYWWQSLSTSTRCSSACCHRSPCSGCSTRYQPNWHLLLPASGQGSGCVHRGHHPRQVGPLDGGLGDCACRRSRPPFAANRGPNRQAWQLGGGSKAAAALQACGQVDQAHGRSRLDVDDGPI